MFWTARTSGLWVRIRLEAVFCAAFVGRGLAMGWSPVQGIIKKRLEGFIISEVNCESEKSLFYFIMRFLLISTYLLDLITLWRERRHVYVLNGTYFRRLDQDIRVHKTKCNTLTFLLRIGFEKAQVMNKLDRFCGVSNSSFSGIWQWPRNPWHANFRVSQALQISAWP